MKHILSLIAVIISVACNAQTISSKLDVSPLLYRIFIPGKVVMKTGAVENADLNYNTNNQSLVFVKDRQFLELTGLENIKEVQLDKALLIPVAGKFYETTSTPGLLVSYSNKKVARAVRTDKTGMERVASAQASNDVSNVYLSRKYQDMSSVAYVKSYWLLKNEKLLPLNDAKQISKSLGVDKNEVSRFIASNKLDLRQETDMREIVKKWGQ